MNRCENYSFVGLKQANYSVANENDKYCSSRFTVLVLNILILDRQQEELRDVYKGPSHIDHLNEAQSSCL